MCKIVRVFAPFGSGDGDMFFRVSHPPLSLTRIDHYLRISKTEEGEFFPVFVGKVG